MASSEPPAAGPEKRFDWEAGKRCLEEIHRKAPEVLAQAVLIGGIACWFYRQRLARAQDPDFKVPKLSEAQENHWLSKDIDFTNFDAQDAIRLLPASIVTDEKGRRHLRVAGVPLGFAQIGVTIDPESAWLDSWIGAFETTGRNVQFRVLDPISLYREKLALSQKRGYESDRLHCALLAEFLRYQSCVESEALIQATGLAEKTTALKFLARVRDRAVEICHDARFRTRLSRSVSGASSLTPAEEKLLREILEER